MTNEEKPIRSIRPSRHERPGFPQTLATLLVDPGYFVFRGIAAIFEGITTAILKWRDAREAKKAAKVEDETNTTNSGKKRKPKGQKDHEQ